MNFLAHIFLSGDFNECMAGNFMADSVRGSELAKFPKGIQDGIKLHRIIDTFTDNHSVTLASKERLRKHYGKYAPVVADIFYDHFLAVHWNQYSAVNLREYTEKAYAFLSSYYDVFPNRSRQFFNYMVKYDILFSYKEIEGIEEVMKGMSRRARFASGMETAAQELLHNYDAYKEEFLVFFPELQKHVLSKQ